VVVSNLSLNCCAVNDGFNVDSHVIHRNVSKKSKLLLGMMLKVKTVKSIFLPTRGRLAQQSPALLGETMTQMCVLGHVVADSEQATTCPDSMSVRGVPKAHGFTKRLSERHVGFGVQLSLRHDGSETI